MLLCVPAGLSQPVPCGWAGGWCSKTPCVGDHGFFQHTLPFLNHPTGFSMLVRDKEQPSL